MASKAVAGLGIVGVFCALLSLVVVINPDSVLGLVDDLESPVFRYGGSIGNLVWALVLFVAAPASRAPLGYRILAGLALVEAIAIPLLPAEAWAGYIRWWTVDHVTFYRFGGGGIGLLFSAFLVYGALPKPTAESP